VVRAWWGSGDDPARPGAAAGVRLVAAAVRYPLRAPGLPATDGRTGAGCLKVAWSG